MHSKRFTDVQILKIFIWNYKDKTLQFQQKHRVVNSLYLNKIFDV